MQPKPHSVPPDDRLLSWRWIGLIVARNMSMLFLKRFLAKPMQIASIVPSSPVLVSRVVREIDFEKASVIVEFGPGEGVHTRRILERARPDARILLLELDGELCAHLRRQFGRDQRVEVLQRSAAELDHVLGERSLVACDYVVSGIPFSIMAVDLKRQIMDSVFCSLADDEHAAFIIYQVTRELVRHGGQFPEIRSRHCLWNIPPMFVTVFCKSPEQATSSDGTEPLTA